MGQVSEVKTCTSCKEVKPISAYRYKKGGVNLKHSFCKKCESDKQRQRRQIQKEKDYESYCLKVQERMLKQNYGISLEEYNRMWEEQEGVCKICKETCSKNLAVDHCHATNKIRGLLCQRCNRALGLFRDRVDLLETAIKYLGEN